MFVSLKKCAEKCALPKLAKNYNRGVCVCASAGKRGGRWSEGKEGLL
jgi:hypothetical protein